MNRSILACALMAAVASVSMQSARRDGEFTSGFATDSLRYDLDIRCGRIWLQPREQAGVRLMEAGLALDARATSCTLSPWRLDQTRELYVAWSADVPARAGLLIEARGLDERGDRDSWSHGPNSVDVPWLVVGSVGRIPLDVAVVRSQEHPRTEARDGWIRFEEPTPYVQFRLRAFGDDALDEPVVVQRLCFAGSNRARAAGRSYPPSGGCSLGNEFLRDMDREAHEQRHVEHPVPFVPMDVWRVDARDADSFERATAVACLRMLLADASTRGLMSPPESMRVDEHVARLPHIESHSLPSRLASIAHACGARAELECASTLREVEGLLHSRGAFALRTIDAQGRRAWVVLSSFDAQERAVVYDPASFDRAPRTWTQQEFEERWFACGGLAIWISAIRTNH